jgi:hypothetical protein
MSHDVLVNILIFVANAGWAIGSLAVGNKHRWGFLVGFWCEAVWLAYAALSGTIVGLGPWCVLGFVVYGRNWLKWKPPGRTNALPAEPGAPGSSGA